MLVFPIRAKMMENAWKHVTAALNVFVRMDTLVKIANFVSTSLKSVRLITIRLHFMIRSNCMCLLYLFKNVSSRGRGTEGEGGGRCRSMKLKDERRWELCERRREGGEERKQGLPRWRKLGEIETKLAILHNILQQEGADTGRKREREAAA